MLPHVDTPPSPSIQEEATASVVIPFMPMFNNLVHVRSARRRKTASIRSCRNWPSAWKWSEDGTTLTFTLRQGVKWHDGKPFTSADVKCTWDMVSGLAPGKIRKSPRQAWFSNLKEISVNGDFEVTFHLKQRAAVVDRPAGHRLVAGLSVPCLLGADAHETDRHRTVSFRRIPAERGHAAGTQSGLLEAGPAVSRRHRVPHRAQPRDPHAGFHRRQVRHDLSDRRVGAAAAEKSDRRHPMRNA